MPAMESGGLLAQEPQSIGGVLDQGFRLFRTGFGRVALYSLIGVLLLFVAQVVGYAQTLRTTGQYPQLLQFPPLVAPITQFVTNILYFAISLAMTHRYWVIAHGGTGTFGASLWIGVLRLLSVVFGLVLFSLAIGLVLVPMFVVAFALWASQPLFTIALCVALAVPALVVLVRFTLFTQETVIRIAGPWTALRNSWRLTRGQFWRTSTILTVSGVLGVVLYIAAIGAASLVAGLLASGALGILIGTAVGAALAGFVLGPYIAAAWLALWHDLRLRSEGGDLDARLDTLAAR